MSVLGVPVGVLNKRVYISPTDIAGLKAWYRADLGITGDPVTAWADQSGNSFNLDTVVGTPDVLSATINGKDAIDFVTSEEIYDASTIAQAYPLHLFAVIRPDDLTDTSQWAINLGNSTSGSHPSFQMSGGTALKAVAPAVAATPGGTPPTAGNWGMLHGVMGFNAGADVKAAWNDAAYGTTASGTPSTNMAGMVLAGLRAEAANSWDGAIAEVILYTAEISGDDLTNLLAYLQDRYALW